MQLCGLRKIVIVKVFFQRAIENKEDDYDYYDDYEFEPLNPSKSEIQSKWFNVRAETKVLVHGYLQDYQTDVMVSMKDGNYKLKMLVQ